MSLIQDQVVPISLLNESEALIFQQSIVCCHYHIKSSWFEIVLDYLSSALHCWFQVHSLKMRSPLPKLIHPVGNSWFWSNDNVRLLVSHGLTHIRDDRNSLDGLAHSHVVCQNSVESVLMKRDHPFERIDLMWLQLAPLRKASWLSCKVVGGSLRFRVFRSPCTLCDFHKHFTLWPASPLFKLVLLFFVRKPELCFQNLRSMILNFC